MTAFTISWDLRTDGILTNEEFRQAFIQLLLDENSDMIKSYTKSCIIFYNNNGTNTQGWYDLIHTTFGADLEFNISEIAVANNQYCLNSWYSGIHESNFDELVNSIKELN